MADTWTMLSGYTPSDYVDTMVFEVVSATKKIKPLSGQTLVAGEKNSQYVRFELDRFWDGIDISAKNFSITYSLAGKYYGTSEAVSAEVSTDRLRFGWIVPEEACCIAGTLMFVLVIKSDGYVLKTQIAETPVVKSLDEESVVPEPTREAWYKEFQARVQEDLDASQAALTGAQDALTRANTANDAASSALTAASEANLAAQDAIVVAKERYGSPLVANAGPEMVDTNRVYVFTGSESAYTYGHWYYYDNGVWNDGGVYNGNGVNTDKTLSIENMPADAKATGDEISELKSGLNDIREVYGVNLFNVDTIKSNTLLDGTTGEETTGNYDASDFIPITAGTKYTIKTFTYSGTPSYRIYFYNSSKGYIRRNVDRVSNSPNGYVFTAVTNAAYIRLNFENRNNAGGTQDPHTCVLVSGQTTINEYIPYYTAYDRTARNNISIQVQALQNKSFCRVSNQGITDANDITFIGYCYLSANSVANLPEQSGAWYLWTTYLDGSNKLQIAYNARGTKPYIRSQVAGTWGAWEQIGKEASETALADFYITSSIAMFPSVGCCGDSFTAGYLYNKTDSQYYDPDYVTNGEYPAIGYPAVMGRLYGVDVTAYAKGGLTSTAYRTDSRGLPALLADEAKYLYIIALGLNDKTQNIPMGVETDIDTEPASATYLGNMGAIIRAIQTHAPMAKIILCKSLWVMNAGATAYNSYYQYISEGVELLSNHLGIPYLETLNDPYFCSRAYVDGLKGLHPTAPLYAGMGKRIGELVGKCVIDNPNYFYNFYVPNA